MVTTAPRHLKLVHDVDPTDQGVRVPQPRGRRLPPTDHQRAVVIERVADAQGWSGSAEEQAVRRRALRHECPRPSCRAAATRQCRRRSRGQWRVLAGMHTERELLGVPTCDETPGGVPER